jgi:hypothetical protein
MTIGILIIAHAPLASALRACVLHVFPEVEHSLCALDVTANEPPEDTLATARIMVDQLDAPGVLVLTDVFGATPCNVAQSWWMACIPSWWPVSTCPCCCAPSITAKNLLICWSRARWPAVRSASCRSPCLRH